MTIRKKELICFAVILVVAIAASLAYLKPNVPSPLRVGYLPTSTYSLVWVAYEKGYFEDEGLEIELKKYSDVATLLISLSNGEVDVAPLTSIATASFASKTKFEVLGGNSLCGSALISRPEDAEKFKTIQDLDEVRIATVKYVPGDILFRYALKEHGVNVNISEYLTPRDAFTACERGVVDVALLWEPYASLAEQEGFNIIMWDKDVYDMLYPCCLQVFTEDYIKDNSYDIIKYLKAMIKAQRFCEEKPSEAMMLIPKYIPEVPDEIMYRSVFYNDPRLGRTRNPLNMTLEMQDLRKFIQMMVDVEFISQKDADTLLQRVDLSYLEEALEILESQKDMSDIDNPKGIWVNSTHYYSSNFTIMPHMNVKDVFTFEDVSPEAIGSIRLEWLSCEQEGEIEFHINGENRGLSYITKEVAAGKVLASCCEFIVMHPKEVNTIVVFSRSCQGTFRYIYVGLQ